MNHSENYQNPSEKKNLSNIKNRQIYQELKEINGQVRTPLKDRKYFNYQSINQNKSNITKKLITNKNKNPNIELDLNSNQKNDCEISLFKDNKKKIPFGLENLNKESIIKPEENLKFNKESEENSFLENENNENNSQNFSSDTYDMNEYIENEFENFKKFYNYNQTSPDLSSNEHINNDSYIDLSIENEEIKISLDFLNEENPFQLKLNDDFILINENDWEIRKKISCLKGCPKYDLNLSL